MSMHQIQYVSFIYEHASNTVCELLYTSMHQIQYVSFIYEHASNTVRELYIRACIKYSM